MSEALFISDPKLTAISNHTDDDEMGNYYDDWENEDDTCPVCNGFGLVSELIDYVTCPHCEGRGYI